ncbi:uncharacterized protein LOC5509154 isoform X2 [Nematostella vectensis]|nr:uncharacterized protein LOC5509154 isoform X2 [Nematostella vectensis]
MERDRVKKKKPAASKPGGAVMISGASPRPPVNDLPITMAEDKDLIMEYTDIFEASGAAPVIDVQDGDAIEESSDTEIVGYSNENTSYTKYDSDSDSDVKEGPPPLDSEDDYEYDDSDLCFTPPQVLSDHSQDPVLLSPTKSMSSGPESDRELFIRPKDKLARQSSEENDAGFREGPPPLDSDDDKEQENGITENGIREDEEEEEEEEKEEEGKGEERHEASQHLPNDDDPDEPEETLIHLDDDTPERVLSSEEDLGNSENYQSEPLRTSSPELLTIVREIRPEPPQEPPPLIIASPVEEASEEEEKKDEEEDMFSGAESSERVVTPEFGRPESESDDMFSNTEEPLLDDGNSPRGRTPEGSSQDVSEDEHLEGRPLLDAIKKVPDVSEEEEDDLHGSHENLLIREHPQPEPSSKQEDSKEGRKDRYDDDDDEDSCGENAGLLTKETKPNKDIFRKQKTVQNTFRTSKTKSNIAELSMAVKSAARAKTTQSQNITKNKEEKASEGKGERKKNTSRPSSVTSSLTSSSENLTTKNTKQKSLLLKESSTQQDRKNSPRGVRDNKKTVKAAKASAPDARKSAPGIAIKADPAKKKSNAALPGKPQKKPENPGKTRTKPVNGRDSRQKTTTEELGKAYKRSAENLAAKRSNERAQRREERQEGSTNGEIRREKGKKGVTKSVAIGTDEENVDETKSQEEKSPRTQPTAVHTKSVRNDNKAKRRSYEDKASAVSPQSIGVHNHHSKTHPAHAHGKHERGKHIWLCRDDEIHKLIAQKASLLKEYETGSLAGRKVFSAQKKRTRSQENVSQVPDVDFAGNKQRSRGSRPLSEVIPERAPYASRKRENRRSLQPRCSGSSSEDEDEKTNRAAGARRAHGSAGTFSVGMASRDLSSKQSQDSDHDETCEYCQAEKAAKKAQERDLAWEGPHHPRNLLLGVVYTAKYLGSSQIMSPQSPNRAVRMQQAQEAVGRIKVPEGEDQPTTDVDIFISTERIKVVNSQSKEVMMDHALRTVSFIADIGDVMVLMARRPPGEQENPLETKPSAQQILASVGKAETDPKMIKITCHVFQADEAQVIAKSIGQSFNVAYQEFLKSNGISEDSVEDAEYNCVLEAQKILGEDLSLLSDETKAREVVVNKKPGEALGVMIVESGWGSMIPTAIIAHLAKDGPAAKSGRVNVGDQILSVNNTSLVGLPLPECQNVIKNSRPGTKVTLKTVSCPPTVQVVVNRPDTKYQLGFSVQNGMICSLMRGSIAERGGVRVGHRIIEINGESVVATSHQHIVDLLATTIGEIRMKTMPASMYRLLVGLDAPQHI